MINRLAALLLLASLAVPAHAERLHFKVLRAADLAAQLKSSKPPVIYDANTAQVRSKYGIIPGAHLLSSPSKYAVGELTADKNAPLVFYCVNTVCTASHQAAKRALSSGYTNVSVMTEGIFGWREAKLPVTKGPSSNAK